MILHLGENVSVDTNDIIIVLDLTHEDSRSAGSMMREIRRQNRVLARQGILAKSAVLCGGARKAGGVTENPRIYLTQISTQTLAQRTRLGNRYMDALQPTEEP
ncbi:MAG: DUF370 domain-containing protein [Clostridia bacterium]|nr:DUF370 domain-containing protein [Clostridia bacterium]